VDIVVLSHRPWILVGMQLRYRYRLEPTAEQRQAHARAFGCARVVYNDELRLREDAHKAGQPFVPDGEVLRLVTTQAKRTPERAWLAEVSAVVPQQSVADLHRAYRNYLRALTKVKAERARRWSRPLPGPPSSVTVTLDRSDRYHASFVVEVARQPLPAVERAIGVDLGLHVLAALSDGTTVANPRWLRQAERRLRRAQCTLSRRRKGSANWHKAKRKVARLHAHVTDARRDLHDRDMNAARNILAAGRAATACGGYVRPGLALAMAATPFGTEAGTTLGTAT
jgi:transposase